MSAVETALVTMLFGEVKEARGLLLRAVARDPVGTAKGNATLLCYEGRVAAAEAILRRLGDDPEAQLMLAQIELDRGGAQSALGWVEAVVERRPGLLTAQVLRGRCLRALGRDREAAAVLGLVVAAVPGSYELRLELAEAQLAAGELLAGVEAAFAAARCDPRGLASYLLIARVLVEAGAPGLAASLLEGAIAGPVGPEPALLEALAGITAAVQPAEAALA